MPKATVHVNVFLRIFPDGALYEWRKDGITMAAGFPTITETVMDFQSFYHGETVKVNCPVAPMQNQEDQKNLAVPKDKSQKDTKTQKKHSERQQVTAFERRTIKLIVPSYEFGTGFEFLDDSKKRTPEDELAQDS